jgi:predicted GNAT family acetyltransferase
MPPPRYNPLAVSRARFLGEDYPETYFPSVGRGRTAFSANISGDLAAATRLELDDILAKRDDQETRAADNSYRRLELADRRRILPFSTEAQIATEKARRTEAEQDEAESPFIHEDNRSIRQAEGERRKAALEDLPSVRADEDIKRKARMEEW